MLASPLGCYQWHLPRPSPPLRHSRSRAVSRPEALASQALARRDARARSTSRRGAGGGRAGRGARPRGARVPPPRTSSRRPRVTPGRSAAPRLGSGTRRASPSRTRPRSATAPRAWTTPRPSRTPSASPPRSRSASRRARSRWRGTGAIARGARGTISRTSAPPRGRGARGHPPPRALRRRRRVHGARGREELPPQPLLAPAHERGPHRERGRVPLLRSSPDATREARNRPPRHPAPLGRPRVPVRPRPGDRERRHPGRGRPRGGATRDLGVPRGVARPGNRRDVCDVRAPRVREARPEGAPLDDAERAEDGGEPRVRQRRARTGHRLRDRAVRRGAQHAPRAREGGASVPRGVRGVSAGRHLAQRQRRLARASARERPPRPRRERARDGGGARVVRGPALRRDGGLPREHARALRRRAPDVYARAVRVAQGVVRLLRAQPLHEPVRSRRAGVGRDQLLLTRARDRLARDRDRAGLRDRDWAGFERAVAEGRPVGLAQDAGVRRAALRRPADGRHRKRRRGASRGLPRRGSERRGEGPVHERVPAGDAAGDRGGRRGRSRVLRVEFLR